MITFVNFRTEDLVPQAAIAVRSAVHQLELAGFDADIELLSFSQGDMIELTPRRARVDSVYRFASSDDLFEYELKAFWDILKPFAVTWGVVSIALLDSCRESIEGVS